MTLAEIQRLYDQQIQLGLTFGVVLVIQAPKRGISGRSVRTPFGLCPVIGSSSRGINIVVKLEQLDRFLKRARKEISDLIDDQWDRSGLLEQKDSSISD